jgi:hypothetical protein
MSVGEVVLTLYILMVNYITLDSVTYWHRYTVGPINEDVPDQIRDYRADYTVVTVPLFLFLPWLLLLAHLTVSTVTLCAFFFTGSTCAHFFL